MAGEGGVVEAQVTGSGFPRLKDNGWDKTGSDFKHLSDPVCRSKADKAVVLGL